MLIGELPRGYDPTKYDDVIFSKDGVHLLRIPYEEFVKGVGGGGGSGKLKYFKESEEVYPGYIDSARYFSALSSNTPTPEEYGDSWPWDCSIYDKDTSNQKIYFEHPTLGNVCIYRKGQYSACCMTFSYHDGNGDKICGLVVETCNEDDATILLATADSLSVMETYAPEIIEEGVQPTFNIPWQVCLNYVEFKVDTITGHQGTNQYAEGDRHSIFDDIYPDGATPDDIKEYFLAHNGFYQKEVSLGNRICAVGIGTGHQPISIDDTNIIFYGGECKQASMTPYGFSVDRNDSALVAYANGDIYTQGNIYYALYQGGTYTWASVKDKIQALENMSSSIWTPNVRIKPRPDEQDPSRLYGVKLGTLTLGSTDYKIWGCASGVKPYNYTEDNSTPRLASANINTYAEMAWFTATSTMSEGKPPADSIILHLPWDNGDVNTLQAQLAVTQGTNPRLFIRCQNSSGVWTYWSTIPRWNHNAGAGMASANRVVCSYNNDALRTSNCTYDEVNRLHGIRSNVQDQIDANAVTVTEYQQSGEHIADISVGNNIYPIYAPTGGGGGGASFHILTGTVAPLDTQGENGDLYLQKASGIVWRYIKFEITKHKTPNNYTQLTELQFLDSNNKIFNFQGSNAWSNQPHYTATDGPASMIDGVIRNDSKALWVCAPTAANPITAIIESRVPLDLSVYSKIRMITGGDAEARDPSTWTISVSNDQQNWILINSETNYVMTSTRLAVGYEGTAILPNTMQPMVIQRYYKDSGHWIPIYN